MQIVLQISIKGNEHIGEQITEALKKNPNLNHHLTRLIASSIFMAFDFQENDKIEIDHVKYFTPPMGMLENET